MRTEDGPKGRATKRFSAAREVAASREAVAAGERVQYEEWLRPAAGAAFDDGCKAGRSLSLDDALALVASVRSA